MTIWNVSHEDSLPLNSDDCGCDDAWQVADEDDDDNVVASSSASLSPDPDDASASTSIVTAEP